MAAPQRRLSTREFEPLSRSDTVSLNSREEHLSTDGTRVFESEKWRNVEARDVQLERRQDKTLGCSTSESLRMQDEHLSGELANEGS